MRGCIAAWLLAAARAVAAAPGVEGEQQQKALGNAKLVVGGTAGLYLSCEETYGTGWERCGDQTSRLCYSPAFGQSCCEVDNGHCGKGTWCAPVAGYCCLDGEDLETCARNAGFELPATKEQRTLGWMGIGIGTVGLFMAFC
ncbi:hypothetical protein C8A05DRAFT_33194 [Staphylotrichum tortipilum]|uniref:Uncharacterized protein n=1 Tax=Staphylotrichum tortipilum TaxID=2831512 RepID=A0AAN6RU39_9PEZI|nr:hypothetical protein C8A05DRAFT_33194 [Staphylotrichum longicolle]